MRGNALMSPAFQPVQANISDSRSTSSTPPNITKRSPNTEQTSEIKQFFIALVQQLILNKLLLAKLKYIVYNPIQMARKIFELRQIPWY